jgi:hypothetical protein
VNFIENIKRKLGNWYLKRKMRSIKRRKTVHNFQTADSVGVLFSSDQLNQFDTINGFLDYLSNNNLKVFALAYVKSKSIPDELSAKRKINFFTHKDLNFYYKPKNTLIDSFIDKDFDILIDLSTKDYFPLTLVNNLSKSHFKVGLDNLSSREYDFMFSLGESHDLYYYIEQIKHYLSNINKEKTIV